MGTLNEVNAVNIKQKEILLKWTREMLIEVQKRLPRQLVMQTLGSFDSELASELYRTYSQLPQNQLAQVHRYLDAGRRWLFVRPRWMNWAAMPCRR